MYLMKSKGRLELTPALGIFAPSDFSEVVPPLMPYPSNFSHECCGKVLIDWNEGMLMIY